MPESKLYQLATLEHWLGTTIDPELVVAYLHGSLTFRDLLRRLVA